MAGQKGVRITRQEQARKQAQAQERTQLLRDGLAEQDAPPEIAHLPGPAPAGGDLGPDEEADGDALIDDGDESESGEPGGGDVLPTEEAGRAAEGRRWPALADLLGSRPPVVLLRVEPERGEIKVRPCAAPSSPKAAEALELLTRFVGQRFLDGRPDFTDEEWAELIGDRPTSLVNRLALLLRLAVKGGETVALGEGKGEAAFTPTDVGLERFANKFAALPDGTPFAIRLLLFDGREKNKQDSGYFARFPRALTLLALRRALRAEAKAGKAVTDEAFCRPLQHALEELLGTAVPIPHEEDIQKLRSDVLKRNGLGHCFPNRAERQREYDRLASSPAAESEESAG